MTSELIRDYDPRSDERLRKRAGVIVHQNPAHPWLVAEVDGRPVGIALLFEGAERRLEVKVYVDEQERRRGIGGRLLAALIERAADCGVERIYARIQRCNAASIALHVGRGFTGPAPGTDDLYELVVGTSG